MKYELSERDLYMANNFDTKIFFKSYITKISSVSVLSSPASSGQQFVSFFSAVLSLDQNLRPRLLKLLLEHHITHKTAAVVSYFSILQGSKIIKPRFHMVSHLNYCPYRQLETSKTSIYEMLWKGTTVRWKRHIKGRHARWCNKTPFRLFYSAEKKSNIFHSCFFLPRKWNAIRTI